MMPDAETLYEVVEGTWPAAKYIPTGPFLLRVGADGGKRVSAATALRNDWTAADLSRAERCMAEIDQSNLFMLRQDEAQLDEALSDRGYTVLDPVNMYCVPVADLAKDIPPRVSTFAVWSPLAIGYDIWAQAGIGKGRWAVMDRVSGAKTSILGRWNDSPAGIAFVAIHDGIAMVHSLEVLPDQRRQGNAERMMAAAAIWARDNGASHLSVICTDANDAANKLYSKLGMTLIGGYHYRQK